MLSFYVKFWTDRQTRKKTDRRTPVKQYTPALSMISWFFNPFPNKPWLSHVCNTSLLKTWWEKEKLFIMSNFSFSKRVFYPFGELSAMFIKFKIVICKLFSFGKVKNLPFGKGLTAKVISWWSVTHMCFLAFKPVQTRISFRSHRLIFSHASAEVPLFQSRGIKRDWVALY